MTIGYRLAALALVSYVIGSIPFGLLVGWTKGIDVRTAGSKNIGATNVGRLLGKKYFWIVFFLDLLKGLVPALTAGWAVNFHPVGPTDFSLWLLVSFAAIFGHMFSLFLGFKGGKGVSTSLGSLLGIWPYYTLPGLVGAAVFVAVFKISRFISLASIIGMLCFPIAYVAIGLALGWPITGEQMPLLVAAIVLAVMIVYKHRGNIARLMAGTENRAPGKTPQA